MRIIEPKLGVLVTPTAKGAADSSFAHAGVRKPTTNATVSRDAHSAVYDDVGTGHVGSVFRSEECDD